MIGIEYDQRLYNRALDNMKLGKGSSRIKFINCCATKYEVDCNATGAYFFNPFSIHILKQVLNNIRKLDKEFNLFFYYPSDDYLNLLDNEIDIIHIEDIDCKSLFKSDDKRECISIYKLIRE